MARRSRRGTSTSKQVKARAPDPGTPRIWSRLAFWCCVGLTLLVPTVYIGSLKDPFRLPKLLTFEGMALVSCALLAMAAWRKLGWRDALSGSAARALLPFLLASLLGALVAGWASLAAWWSLLVGTILLCWWSVAGVDAKLLIERWLPVSALVLAVLGLLQSAGVRLLRVETDRERLEMTSLAGNPADLAVFLVVPALWASRNLLVRWRDRGRGVPLIPFALLLVFVTTIALTRTVSAVLAVAIAGVYLALRMLPRRRALGAVSGLVLLLAIAVVATPLRGRALGKAEALFRGEINEVLTGRVDGVLAAFEMFRREPIVGIGFGRYGSEFNRSKETLIEEGFGFYRRHGRFSTFGNAHNELAEVAAEGGLLGLVAIGWTAFAVVGALRRGRLDLPDRAFLEAALLSLALLSLGFFPLRTALTALPNLLVLCWVFEAGDKSS